MADKEIMKNLDDYLIDDYQHDIIVLLRQIRDLLRRIECRA